MAQGRRPGRAPGVKNRYTKSVKEALLIAFDQLGGVPALVEWGRLNRSDFYKLLVRVLPSEVANPTSAFGDGGITVIISSVELPERNVIEQVPELRLIER
jgi:hypothetical protein